MGFADSMSSVQQGMRSLTSSSGNERQTILKLRDERRIDDGVLREMEHELDLSETRLKAAARHLVRD